MVVGLLLVLSAQQAGTAFLTWGVERARDVAVCRATKSVTPQSVRQALGPITPSCLVWNARGWTLSKTSSARIGQARTAEHPATGLMTTIDGSAMWPSCAVRQATSSFADVTHGSEVVAVHRAKLRSRLWTVAPRTVGQTVSLDAVSS